MFIPNENELKMEEMYNITTEVPPLPIKVPIENYPDYDSPNNDNKLKLRDVIITILLRQLSCFNTVFVV